MTRTVYGFFPLSALALAISMPTLAADQGYQRSVEDRLSELEQKPASTITLPKNLSFTGLIEVEGVVGEDYDSNSYSDLVVATVELGMSAQVTDNVTGELVFLYEEDDTDFGVDVATIKIDKLVGPVDFTVGKMYLPFGRFETALINDTLVLELAETHKTAALFGVQQDGLGLGAYIFDGSQDRERHVENYGFTVGFEQEAWAVGLDYISALTESDGVGGVADDIDTIWYESAPAFSLSGQLTAGNIKVIGEYLATTSDMKLFAFSDGIKPEALQLEADMDADLNGKTYTFAIAYQMTDDAVDFLPEQRLSIGCSTEIYKNVTLGGEFWHDEDYSENDGGSGGDSNSIVANLAVSF